MSGLDVVTALSFGKLSVMYEQCGDFILKCCDHTQYFARSFSFPLELEIHHVQVAGDAS
jgi:hypothetical protein